jgi:hypothetical protein
VRAVAVAAPVLEYLAAPTASSWKVVGTAASVAYFARDGFVVAVTAPGVPLMPNGIAVDRVPAHWPSVGSRVRGGRGFLELGDQQVRWSADDPPVWDPSPSGAPCDRAALQTRARGILRSCGIRPTADPAALTDALAANGVRVTDDPDGRRGVIDLLASVGERDPARARSAANALLGRGGGLTPEGDDLLCGVAATVARFGADLREAWLASVCPPDAAHRSSNLSVTLLRLAAAGSVTQPADRVLDLDERDWQRSLRQLLGVGSSTGRAYALSIGAAALLIGSRGSS